MVISPPSTAEAGPSDISPPGPSWRVAAAAVAATLTVGIGVAALFHSAMDSAVPPQPPPGAQDAAGTVETLPASGAPSEDLTEPTGAPEDGEEPDEGNSPPEQAPPAPAEPGSAVAPDWVDRVAAETGIPRRALQGYASAQVRVTKEDPQCQVSWPTLAGIGWVESQHGTYAGGEIGPDGTTTVDVIGVPLDGGPGLARIPDTNGGELDGDKEWDRALGPMQFIPTTWSQWGSDGNGNGTADPHNIDDAAYSAARYLCAQATDLTDEQDWWEAILAYNRSKEYGEEVLAMANEYAATASE